MPRADLTLRRVPEGVSDEVALFPGDVMGTGFHSIEHAGTRTGDTVAVLGLGPVGLCAVQAARAAGATRVFAIDSVAARLEMAAGFGAVPLHLTEDDPKRAVPIGLAWLKGLTLRLGLANVIAHVDRVLALIEAGLLDPAPLVTHRMKLEEAAEAYRLYDNREALKIVLTP